MIVSSPELALCDLRVIMHCRLIGHVGGLLELGMKPTRSDGLIPRNASVPSRQGRPYAVLRYVSLEYSESGRNQVGRAQLVHRGIPWGCCSELVCPVHRCAALGTCNPGQPIRSTS